MKHIGIVAVSAEGAALCYRTICLEGAASLGLHAHPEISLHNLSLSAYQRLIDHARGRCYYAVLTDRGLDHWGHYVDEYRQLDGRWLFKRRGITVDAAMPGGWGDTQRR